MRGAFDRSSSHILRGQSDRKNEFDVTQEPISVTQMCLPLPQIKINHCKPQCSPVPFKEPLRKTLVISLTGTFVERTKCYAEC